MAGAGVHGRTARMRIVRIDAGRSRRIPLVRNLLVFLATIPPTNPAAQDRNHARSPHSGFSLGPAQPAHATRHQRARGADPRLRAGRRDRDPRRRPRRIAARAAVPACRTDHRIQRGRRARRADAARAPECRRPDCRAARLRRDRPVRLRHGFDQRRRGRRARPGYAGRRGFLPRVRCRADARTHVRCRRARARRGHRPFAVGRPVRWPRGPVRHERRRIRRTPAGDRCHAGRIRISVRDPGLAARRSYRRRQYLAHRAQLADGGPHKLDRCVARGAHRGQRAGRAPARRIRRRDRCDRLRVDPVARSHRRAGAQRAVGARCGRTAAVADRLGQHDQPVDGDDLVAQPRARDPRGARRARGASRGISCWRVRS